VGAFALFKLLFIKVTEFANHPNVTVDYSAVDDPSAAPLTGIALGEALLDFLRNPGCEHGPYGHAEG